MSERLLKIIIYLAGVFCLFVFVAVRSLPVMNSVLVEKIIPEHWEFTRYGELYNMNRISHFKKELPAPIRKYRFSEKHPDISEADILIFGDSFLDFSRQTTLPERLNDTLNKRVFFHRFVAPQRANPFCVLPERESWRGKAEMVIYETVERNIPMKFDRPFYETSCEEEEQGLSVDRVAAEVFPADNEKMYKEYLKRSVFTTHLFALSARIKFDLFGYISSQTPVYKTGEDPWLFLNRQLGNEPGRSEYKYSQEEIDRYCDNIALLAAEIEQKWNMEMIFIPVPNKYTLYHTVVNEDPYNEFLPRLHKGLDKRNVKYINLYDPFMNSDEVLYYGTDTHWNSKGIDIALEKLLELIKPN
jgi:hypothetical protein